MMVNLTSATESSDRKFASLPSPRDQSQACTSSREGTAFWSVHHRASTSTDQEPIVPVANSRKFFSLPLRRDQSCIGTSSRDRRAFLGAQPSSQPGASTSLVNNVDAAVSTSRQESSVSRANPVSSVLETSDGGRPIHQASSSSAPPTGSPCSSNKSWPQEKFRENQQVRDNLRYVPNWTRSLRRSLPPTELPRCHENATEWPALGYNQSRTEELEMHHNDPSVSNSRIRVKPRFRDFFARHQDLQQDAVRNNTATHGIKTVRKEDVVRGEAKLMMLNRDFMVTSPVRENLLVTIALTSQRNTKTEGMEEELELAVRGSRMPVQILIGKFTAFSSFLRFKLCRDALRVKFEQNAGGSSTISESLSVEYFARRFQAQDVVTEMEVEYWSSNWKKVDYICTLYGQRVGVSVTRAMCYPDPNAFSTDIAYRLLYKKLYGLVVARDGVSKRHSFCKCILHVWCETQRTAEIMKTMYAGVRKDLEISDDVIMVLTVADGLHARPIFYEHALDNS